MHKHILLNDHIKTHLIETTRIMQESLLKEGISITGLETGFELLDLYTLGLQPADLIVVAGRPGTGKTTLAMNIVEHVIVKLKKPCVVFTLETLPKTLATRLLCSLSDIKNIKLQHCDLNESEWAKVTNSIEILSDSSLYIQNTLGDNIDVICQKAHKFAGELDNIGLIVIDYLQLSKVH